MRIYLVGLTILIAFTGRLSFAQDPYAQSENAKTTFLFPEQLGSQFAKADFSFGEDGFAQFSGHLSYFNLPRAMVKDMLPPQLELAAVSSVDFHPVIVVWGEVLPNSVRYLGITWPVLLNLNYNELQMYIPGVYSKSDPQQTLGSYVPRMLVDSSIAKVLGDNYFFKKVIVDIAYDGRQFSGGNWIELSVEKSNSDAQTWSERTLNDPHFQAMLDYVPNTNIVGADDSQPALRCSGFAWSPRLDTSISTSQVSMRILRPLTDGMEANELPQSYASAESYQMSWDFRMDADFKACP